MVSGFCPAQRPLTLNTQKEIIIDLEKHKDCQLESATMDSSSSLQGATGTAKTDPSNAYQQQLFLRENGPSTYQFVHRQNRIY
jgi:hypothetical protein